MEGMDIFLAKEVVYLIANRVEPRGIQRMEQLDKETIQKNLALIDLVSALKAASVKAASSGSDAIDFSKDHDLKTALDNYLAVAPEAAAFIPDDGILHKDSIPDVQRLLDTQMRRPTTMIEYTMIEVGRLIYDQQAINDSGKEILKDYIESVRHWLKNTVR